MNTSIKILILEHNPNDLERLQYELKKSGLGYAAEIVQTLEDFEKALRQFRPDIILAAYALPGFDGHGAFNLVRQMAPKIPFILVSGTIGEENAVELIRMGVTDYVLKDKIYQVVPKMQRALKEVQVRKQKRMAIKQLRKGEEQLRKIMNLSLDVICTVDQEGRFVTIGAASKTVWGYAPEELIGRSVLDLVHDDDKASSQEAIAGFARGKDLVNFENRYIRQDNRVVPLFWSAHWDAEEQLGYIVARDATEIKKAAEKIKQNEKRFRSLLQNSTDGLILLAADGQVLERSPSALKILGLRPDENGDKFRSDLVHPEDLPMLNQTCAQVKENQNASRTIEYRILSAAGTYKWLETTIHNQLHEPAVGAIVFNFRDITERKLVEIALRENETRLKQAQAIGHVGSWELNLINQSTTWSEELYRIFGLPMEENPVSYDLFVSFIHPEDLPGVLKRFEEANSNLEPGSIEYRSSNRQGGIRYVVSQWQYDLDEKGRPYKIFGILQDVTERKQIEIALQASEARLKQAQAIGHLGNWEANFMSGITEWSDEIYQIYGGDKEQIQASFESFVAFIHPDDRPFALNKLEKAQAALENGSLDCRIQTLQGEVRYVYSEWQYERDEKGRPYKIFGILLDITDRKLSEMALERSEARLNEAQAIGHIGNLEVNWADGSSIWSDELYRIFGVAKKVVNPSFELFGSVIHPEERAAVLGFFEKSIAALENARLDFRVLRENGEVRYVTTECQFEFEHKNGPIRLFGVVQDITGKRLAEITLEKSEAKYRNLFNVSPIPMWVFDEATLAFLDVNEAAIQHYGYTKEEFLSMTLREIRPQAEISKMESVTRSNKGELGKYHGTVQHVIKTGETIQVDIKTSYLDLNGKQARLVAATDISERVQYLEAVKTQNARLREIAWTQSHVVRAPLARMMGLIDLLQHQAPEQVQDLEVFRFIVASARELDAIIRDIVRKTDQIKDQPLLKEQVEK